jgi:N-acetylmuramoyl-L-alanine amidase
LLARGYRVAMTRTGPVFRYGNGGNIARAQFCNRRHAALMLRIHADGSTNTSLHGFQTLYPRLAQGLDGRHLRPQPEGRSARPGRSRAGDGRRQPRTRQADRPDRFQLGDVPSILVECGFMSNHPERRLLQSSAYEWKVARG